MSRPAPEPQIRWTVTVTARTARGIPRSCTFYRTEPTREDAECAALEAAVAKWPASTKPVKIGSYASVHIVRADQSWREVCQWQERSLEPPLDGGGS